ncbi:MAG: DNA-directed RNA polymerase subunit beta [Candidatus Berkelbacteria bacterium Licking1014_7]|uniref:DNA-directed RNA polymerase subunit beta n=1 Tax=Candidatus Berkelbacteria bacterium Licking1014_7 TaxID=2017147 RepID=A0A554LKK4_9BACT|nr:MAG: DNA-directed RNA polymerase subunit beta [Candidatus Berkelbacteria bacterium Licking1014_7]
MARKYFSPKTDNIQIPDLIDIQKKSYRWLFSEGIKELIEEISPIEDFTDKKYRLELGEYEHEEPKVDEEKAKERNLTYKAPLKCRVKLTHKETGKIQEADVYLSDFPLMTPRGTFIINGIERVVVTQIVRSYGIMFTALNFGTRKLFGAKIIPSRGAWVEFETSNRDIIFVKIDRRRKMPLTTFLKALGDYTNQDLIEIFQDVDTDSDHQYIKKTLQKDATKNQAEALLDTYKKVRPGDLATAETAQSFFDNMFFDPKRYSLGKVGRYKMNRRLNLNKPNDVEHQLLLLDDVIAIAKEIILLNNTSGAQPDDIDHLKNRRLRAVGELIQSRLRVGMLRLERIARDRMSYLDPNSITPAQLINNRPILAVLQEFFASSQLSQFMDQTNPLSELEHKRRIAATGPGGLSRERAGFEVRDVHNSHYGRICPIATPEGPNIGLVGQLATYAKINEFGFIETPFLKVDKKNGKANVSGKIEFLDAFEEEKYHIAPASTNIKNNYIVDKKVIVRSVGGPIEVSAKQVDYIDVSSRQIISVSTALIPFIEHNDATRASMGSNMVKQAVPLVRYDSPVVGTGMEEEAAKSSGQILKAQEAGLVESVSADKIVIKNDKSKIVYPLAKFVRSNQSTCINQHPSVNVGDKITAGQIIAESSAIDNGELALGQNLLVAFASYMGGNYEDAIIISDRLVRDDEFTSIHIETYGLEVRDTKLGPEVITRDIPNVGEETLANLDDLGIIRIGAEIKEGDILVGKISPKGESELTAEEKLLRAIFGEKAKDVMDTSLRLPHGEFGKVIDIKIFEKDKGDELPTGVYQSVEVSIAQLRKIQVGDKLAGRHGNKGVISKILPAEDMPHLEDGTPVDIILNPMGVISRMNLGQILETHLGWAARKLGFKVASPAFTGIKLDKIQDLLKKADLPESGKTKLIDGKTGEIFNQDVTVGIIYMMKLIHMVDDKIHSRSIGPYSIVTQQPLGGKAQFGGQRFGEMEVWALEAYGAAHTLQEILTIKSDDIQGRSRAYEAIIKNEEIQKPSIPASFNVLMKELQSLSLNVEPLENGKVQKIKPNTRQSHFKEASTAKNKNIDREITEILAQQEENPPQATPEEVME